MKVPKPGRSAEMTIALIGTLDPARGQLNDGQKRLYYPLGVSNPPVDAAQRLAADKVVYAKRIVGGLALDYHPICYLSPTRPL